MLGCSESPILANPTDFVRNVVKIPAVDYDDSLLWYEVKCTSLIMDSRHK